MSANDFRLLTKAEYLQDLVQLISEAKPGQRVALSTMNFQPDDPLVGAITPVLEAAARRGVKVYFAIDAFNFLKAGHGRPGPLWPRASLPKHLPEKYGRIVRELNMITTAGGHCAITNMPQRPFSRIHSGRSHIKAAVIGDIVYIGGCNLNRPEQLDVMARWHDTKAADWVFDAVREMVEVGDTRKLFSNTDRRLDLANDKSLLIDSGKSGQSIILKNAYQLIDEAEKHIFLTCQYFPGGETGQRLKAAFERGVQVDIFFSHQSVHGLEAPAHHLYALLERRRVPSSFFVNRLAKGLPKLHAKVLCTEKGALLGSHNFMAQGVRFGTAEIALRHDSPDFSEKLRTFMLRQITD